MKLNLDAIKDRIAKLNGGGNGGNSSDIQLWKPKVGTYTIRGMHWPTRLKLTNDGEPFVERHFYYNIARRGFLAPEQFGKEDPIADLRIKLFKSGTPDDRVIAKKLFSSMRCYMPIVVKEGKGADPDTVIVWSFGKQLYEKLLGYFVKKDIGDYLDPHEGFDIDVKVTQKPGKQYPDTDIDLARRPSKLADDDAKMELLFDQVPDLRPMWTEKSTAEVKAELDSWLNGGSTDDSPGTERSNSSDSKTELDKIVDDVKENNDDVKKNSVEKASPKKKQQQKKVSKPVKKEKEEVVDESVDDDPEVETSLDSAFDELMED